MEYTVKRARSLSLEKTFQLALHQAHITVAARNLETLFAQRTALIQHLSAILYSRLLNACDFYFSFVLVFDISWIFECAQGLAEIMRGLCCIKYVTVSESSRMCTIELKSENGMRKA